ncbi:MAG TPA: Uma2 family endonuclease, partial [Pirellula sp.]|nr:Uma2 family endonuclease [Pirellula sp.]
SWTNDYRVPDIVLLDEQTIANLRDTHCQGPCTVALEIRSPNDESFEKMEFYARLQVSELWFVDRDSKKLEGYSLTNGRYRLFETDRDGWTFSQSVAIQMRSYEGELCFQIIDQPDSRRLL